MSNSCPAKGWRLREAIQEIAPRELWDSFEAARQDLATEYSQRRSANDGPDEDDSYTGFGVEDEQRNAAAQDAKRRHLSACENNLRCAFQDELIAGRFYAEGAPDSPQANPIRIKPACWEHVRVRDWDVSVMEMDGCPPVRFYDVRIFVTARTTAERRRASSSKAASECEQWLMRMMRTTPMTERHTKTQYKIQAMEKFKGLSARSFDRAWGNACKAIEAGWDAAGRPRKSSHGKSPHQ